MSGTDETLTGMALDAPLVVRVEVGSVTLTARDWAALRPGDVLETGLRLSEPAVLRVAGREVARGELVSIDGELGVRIHEIIEGERSG
jgi:flagellar motor switch/type III secretory pathway protein FliN